MNLSLSASKFVLPRLFRNLLDFLDRPKSRFGAVKTEISRFATTCAKNNGK